MNIEKIKNELCRRGWSLVNGKFDDNGLVSFSRSFGSIIPDSNEQIIQVLKPKDINDGIKGSFSYNYGYSQFPFHTDTAYWAVPAKVIIMASEFKSNCDTYLFDSNEIMMNCSNEELLMFKRSVFLQKTFMEQKFSSLFINENGLTGFKYDPNIMFPVNNDSKKVVKLIAKFLNKAKTIKIEWTGNNIVLIDNWRFLHCRGDSSKDQKRTLKRIYLK